MPNPAVNRTLRDKAAQRRLLLRWRQLHERSFIMRILLAAIVSVALGGCGDSSNLSRDKAKVLIQDFAGFNAVAEYFPNESSAVVSWDGLHLGTLNSREKDALLSNLVREGVITYSTPPDSITSSPIALTEAGNKLMIEKNNRFFKIKLCDRHIIEVTGIEQSSPQTAVIHFTYKTTNQTPFGKTTPKACSGETHEGGAVLNLFDDGWRVGNVSPSNS